jgi:hypothetical protein
VARSFVFLLPLGPERQPSNNSRVTQKSQFSATEVDDLIENTAGELASKQPYSHAHWCMRAHQNQNSTSPQIKYKLAMHVTGLTLSVPS